MEDWPVGPFVIARGLALYKNLVEINKDNIKVESTESQDGTFIIALLTKEMVS